MVCIRQCVPLRPRPSVKTRYSVWVLDHVLGSRPKPTELHAGQIVKLDGHEAMAEDYSGAKSILSGLDSILGRIYKIYTRGEYMEETEVGSVGDILIVELGSR